MEFKQDDSCSVQKSSCFLEIPFFKLSLTNGTLYNLWYFYLFYDSYLVILFFCKSFFTSYTSDSIKVLVCSQFILLLVNSDNLDIANSFLYSHGNSEFSCSIAITICFARL